MGEEARPRLSWLIAGVLFVLVSFALNSAVTRWIVAGGRLDPGLTTSVRFIAGAVVLALLLAVRRRPQDLVPRRSNLLAVFWLAAYAFAISYGYGFIGAAAGTFVFYACVLLTMTLAGALMQKSPPPGRAILGGLVALSGLALLTVGDAGDVTLLGIVLLATTGASWGAYSLLGKRRPDPLHFTAQNFVLLALVLGVFAAVLLAAASAPVITIEGIIAAAVMGGITTALSYAVWYWALQSLDATQAGTYQLAIPVLAATLGVVWLDEALTLQLVLAGVLVLLGMGLGTPRRTPRTPVVGEPVRIGSEPR